MSTVSPYLQVPANGNKTSVDSSAIKYEDLVRSSETFWCELRAMLGSSLKVPTVGGNTLNLHRLFVEVTSRGGIAKVIEDRRWREVIAVFNFPATITSASYLLRNYYTKLLNQMERVYYLQKPASSIQPTKEAMKRLSPNLKEGIKKGTDESQVGLPIQGVIDGKFESGYLVTMKVGSKKMKEVLYHAAKTPSQPQRTMEATSAMASSSQHPHEKKTKLDVVDHSQEPKCYKSGYHFFLAEQYARLTSEYNEGKITITKMIGQMWENLPESEKQVYQDKRDKDVKKYRIEMLEYKAAHESGASASAAARLIQ